MARPITTIKLSRETADKLNKLKIHPRQSYEEVIVRLLNRSQTAEKRKNKITK